MPSTKPKKQVERFKAGMNKFATMFATLTELEEFDRKEHSRNGMTTVKIYFKTKGAIPPTRAANVGKKMAKHFSAWFSPTHYEEYDFFRVEYVRGEGSVLVSGRI